MKITIKGLTLTSILILTLGLSGCQKKNNASQEEVKNGTQQPTTSNSSSEKKESNSSQAQSQSQSSSSSSSKVQAPTTEEADKRAVATITELFKLFRNVSTREMTPLQQAQKSQAYATDKAVNSLYPGALTNDQKNQPSYYARYKMTQAPQISRDLDKKDSYTVVLNFEVYVEEKLVSTHIDTYAVKMDPAINKVTEIITRHIYYLPLKD